MNNVLFAMLGVPEILVILLIVLFWIALVGGIVFLVMWLVRRGNAKTPAIPPAQPQPVQPNPTPSTCHRCGTALPADSPQGLCPRCVMGVGLATQTEASGEYGPHGTRVTKPPPSPADIAKNFPQLEILDCLGRGGMGVVYKARQPKLNRLVALKILAPEKGADPKFAERFLREAQALARLGHPNIVTVHDFGEADGMFYLLMEYVDGATLRQLLREGRMKPETALTIVPKICEALQFAHEQGVVHRDIKPENVLLDKQGRVKIADFGIAKIVGGEGRAGSPLPAAAAQPEGGTHGVARPTVHLTQDQVLGTPHYMAPEQVEHPQTVDHRADIYSLGVVFYEMLTGELPLGKFQPPSKKVQVDVRLDEVVLHALEKEPERRYQHVSEVKSDVETIATTPGSAGVPPAGFGVAPNPSSSKWSNEPSGATPDGARGTRALPIAELERARQEIKAPAIALFIVGCLNLGVALPVLAYSYVTAGVTHGRVSGGELMLLLLVGYAVTLIGASAMRRLGSYGLAIAGTICAMILPLGLIIGLPVGIWSLIVLNRREVREAFGKGPMSSAGTGHPKRGGSAWKVAIALLVVLAIPVSVLVVIIGLRPLHWNQAQRYTQNASAEFRYRIFEADAALVDRLIPPATRSPGVMPGVESHTGSGHGVSEKQIGDFKMRVQTEMTESQMAEISAETLRALVSGMAEKPGLLVDRKRVIPLWPLVADTWGYASSDTNFFGACGGGGFLGFRRKDGASQARIEYSLNHALDAVGAKPNLNVRSRIAYEGNAPANGALAFLVPFVRRDEPPRYLVIAFEIGNGPSVPNIQNVSFGPVIERVLTNDCAMDLDTGKQAELLEFKTAKEGLGGINEKVAATATWMEQQGMDALFADEFTAYGMKIKVLNEEDWNKIGPSQLAEAIRSIDPKSPPQVMLEPGSAPYAFQTREGHQGIVQVLVNENPRGVKIRYKLVSSTEVPIAPQNIRVPIATGQPLDLLQKKRESQMRQVVGAIRQYVLEHGQWPAQIADLNPYLADSTAKVAASEFEYCKPNLSVEGDEQTFPVLFEKEPNSAGGQFTGFSDGRIEFIKKPVRLPTGRFNQDFYATLSPWPKGRFSLNSPNGKVEITGWDRNEVLIQGVKCGEKQELVEKVGTAIERGADYIAVQTHIPWKPTGPYRENVSVEYTIHVPRATRLDRVKTENGKVVIEGVTGDIAASSGNGLVSAKGSQGDLKLSTANGQITAEPASLSGNQFVSLDADNGSITIRLPPDANATIKADTRRTGSITSEFPSLEVKEGPPLGIHLEGTLGNGSAKVEVQTANGSISIRRGK